MQGANLRIRYRSGDDEATEREVTVMELESPYVFRAFCHLRESERSFTLSRIEEAIDLSTGEAIRDIWLYFGLPSPKPQMPVFTPPAISLSADKAKNRHNADKKAPFQYFRWPIPVVATARKRQLWALFDNRCFNCGCDSRLELDHHVPQRLGGRLVPGNIVLLCAACNSVKRTTHPTNFYTADQLATLDPMLVAELDLFYFRFDWTRFDKDPTDYLLSLGVTEEEADTALTEYNNRLAASAPPVVISIEWKP